MNSRRTQMLLTAVGLVILGAMEVYVPSIADTADSTKIVAKKPALFGGLAWSPRVF